MKKLIAVLFALLAIESYGIYGAMQAKRIVYSCTIEVGPLCFAWDESSIAKLLGPAAAEKLEGKLADAKQSLEQDLVQKALSKDKGGLGEALEKAGDLATEGVEAAKKVLDEH